MSALRRAGTSVLEPVQHLRLEIPADTAGPVAATVARLGGVPQAPVPQVPVQQVPVQQVPVQQVPVQHGPVQHGPEHYGPACLLAAEIPAARLHELQQQLPALTRGEGVVDIVSASYRPARKPVPIRTRTDHNPLNRAEYLLHVVRRV